MKTKFSSLAIILAVFLSFSIGCRFSNFLSKESNSNNSTTNSNETKPVSTSSNNSSVDKSNQNISTLCRNVYYPVGPNVERKYHIKYQKGPVPDQDYTEKYTDFNGDKFIAKTEFKEVGTTINWICTADGLLATQYGNSIDMKSGGGSKIETLDSKGVSFPSESLWNTGEKWNMDYNIKETVKSSSGQDLGGGDGTVDQASEIVGNEEITVPAGTFQTFKVTNKTTLKMTIKVSGMSVPTNTIVESTGWFAKDVGMVKLESRLGGITTATTELLSYNK